MINNSSNVYITSFIINKNTSKSQFDLYFHSFKKFIELFHRNQNDFLYVFIDEYYYFIFNLLVKHLNVIPLKINHKWLIKNFHSYKYVYVNEKINAMSNCNIFGKDFDLTIAEENINGHPKLDFIMYVINNFSFAKAYIWIDFSYFSNKKTVPGTLLDTTKFNLHTVTFNLNETIQHILSNPYNAIQKNANNIDPTCFVGNASIFRKMYVLYYNILRYNYKVLKLNNSPSRIFMQCFFKNKDLFSFYRKINGVSFF